MDLRKRGEYTQDLFTTSQPARTDALMNVMDKINKRWGHDCLGEPTGFGKNRTLRYCGQP